MKNWSIGKGKIKQTYRYTQNGWLGKWIEGWRDGWDQVGRTEWMDWMEGWMDFVTGHIIHF